MSTSITYDLLGNDVSASSAMSNLAGHANDVSAKIGSTFSNLGSKIGGEIGELTNMVGEGFTKLGESSGGLGTKLAAVGAAGAALGLALQHMASADEQAQKQLDAAIQSTGASFSDYSAEVDKAISKGENFGHSAAETQNALAQLTLATGDPIKAFEYLGTVEDLAAAKHESLADAAATVGKILDGNTKTLKTFNITLDANVPKAQAVADAMTQLANKLSGQASAAADTFNGKIDSVKTHLTDWVAKIGGEVGPALTYLSTVVGVVGGALQILAARNERAAASALEEAAAEELQAKAAEKTEAALLGETVTAATLATDMESLRIAQINAAIATDALGEASLATSADVEALMVASEASDFAMGPLGLVIGAVGVAAALAGGSFGLFGDSQKKAAAPVAGLTQLLLEQNGALGEGTRQAIAKEEGDRHLFDSTDKLGMSQAYLTEGLNGNTAAYKANVAQLQETIDKGKAYEQGQTLHRQSLTADQIALGQQANAAQTALDAYTGLNASIGVNVSQARDQIAASKDATTGMDDLKFSIDTTSAAFKAGADEATLYKDAVKELTDATITGADKQDVFLDSLNSVKDSFVSSKNKIVDQTDAGRKNYEQVLTSIQGINDLTQYYISQGMTTDQVTAKLKLNEGQLVATAGGSKTAQAQIQGMIDTMVTTPSEIDTKMNVDAVAAMEALNGVQAKLQYIAGLASSGSSSYGAVATTFNSTYSQHAAVNDIPHAAQGGIFPATPGGRLVHLAEAGEAEAVIPLSKLGDMGGGGGNTTIHVTVQGVVSGSSKEIGQWIGKQLTTHIKSGGRVSGVNAK